MQLFRSNRRIALLAVAALLLATTAYLAHGSGDSGSPHNKVQCDLCLQFSGTAGTPATAALAGQALQVARQPVLLFQSAIVSRKTVDSRLPRGPPR